VPNRADFRIFKCKISRSI